LTRRPARLFTTLALALACCVAALPAGPATARDRSLARTPPMGWNSWYGYWCEVTEDQVLANARALVTSGLAARGYRYVNVDGCWSAKTRDGHGRLRANPRTFPSGMAALGRKIHAMGLEFGVYTSAGRTICLHAHPGSYRHFRKDFRTFASWKVDYVKVDWCNKAPSQHLRTAYRGIARAAKRAGRRMITTVSTPGLRKPWIWGQPYGNSWRIAPDANGTWSDVLRILDVDAPLWRYAGPSGWNDADMLQVGNGKLTPDEERAHFSLWSMLASPLLAGNRLPEMSPATVAILGNPRVIAVNQDRLGKQGRRVRRHNGREVWVKQLRKRCRALLLLNRTGAQVTIKVDLRRLPRMGTARSYGVADLWSARRWPAARRLTPAVPSHGVRMLRACPR
jgi:hypothetical protein